LGKKAKIRPQLFRFASSEKKIAGKSFAQVALLVD
jgi:hypothetical protein